MGVQGLWDLVSPAGQRVHLSALENKVIAVDASIWLYHFVKAMRDEHGNMVKGAHLLGFFQRICKLLYLKIRPVFVFDGPPPELKRRTLRLRAQQRDSEERQRRKAVEKLLRNQLQMHILQANVDLGALNAILPGEEGAEAAAAAGAGAEEEGEASDGAASSSSVVEMPPEEPEPPAARGDAARARRPRRRRMPEAFRRVPEAFRGFMAKRRGVAEVELPELPAEPLRDILQVPDRSQRRGRMREPDEWKGYMLPDGGVVTVPLDGPVPLEEFEQLSPKTRYTLLQRAKEAWYGETRLKAVQAKDDMGAFVNVQLETFLRDIRTNKEIERVKKDMAAEVKRPAGDGIAEGDVYTPPSWLRPEAPSEGGPGVGGDCRAAVGGGAVGPDTAPPSGEAGGRSRDRRKPRQLGGAEPVRLRPVDGDLLAVDGELRNTAPGIAGCSGGTEVAPAVEVEPAALEAAARPGSAGQVSDLNGDVSSAIDLFGAAFFQEDESDGVEGHEDAAIATTAGRINVEADEEDLSTAGWCDFARSHLADAHHSLPRGCPPPESCNLSAEVLVGEGGRNQVWFEDVAHASPMDDISIGASFGAESTRSQEAVPKKRAAAETLRIDNLSASVSDSVAAPPQPLPHEASLSRAVKRSSLPDAAADYSRRSVAQRKSPSAVELVFAQAPPSSSTLEAASTSSSRSPGQTANPLPSVAEQVIEAVTPEVTEAPVAAGAGAEGSESASPRAMLDVEEVVAGAGPEGSEAASPRAMPDVEEVAADSARQEEGSSARQPSGAAAPASVGAAAGQSAEGGTEQAAGDAGAGTLPAPSARPRAPLPPAVGEAADREWCSTHFQYRWRCRQDGVDGACAACGGAGGDASSSRRPGNAGRRAAGGRAQAAHSQMDRDAGDLGDEELEDLEMQRLEAELEDERQELLGDLHRAKRGTDTVTPEMQADIEALLESFGIPFVHAPAEAEAQCAFLANTRLVDAVASDDSDTLVFGSQEVYRRLFSEDHMVECYTFARIQAKLGLVSGDLIVLAMLLGCDYTVGIHGVGIVNGLEIVRAFTQGRCSSSGIPRPNTEDGWLDALRKFRTWAQNVAEWGTDSAGALAEDGRSIAQFKKTHRNFRSQWSFPDDFPNPQVHAAFVQPRVDQSLEPFAWAPVDTEQVMARLVAVGLDEAKVHERLDPALARYSDGMRQPRITEYMVPADAGDVALVRSERMREALRGLRGEPSPERSPTATSCKR